MNDPLDDEWVKAVIDRRFDNGSVQREQFWTYPKTGQLQRVFVDNNGTVISTHPDLPGL